MTKNNMPMWIVLYSLLFLMGWLAAYFAYAQYKKTSDLLAIGTRATATVIDLLEFQDKDGTLFSPVFGFMDKSGGKVTYTDAIKSRPATYKIGEEVSIVYNPKNTNDLKVISFWGLYRWGVILLMVAAPLLILGGAYLLYAAT